MAPHQVINRPEKRKKRGKMMFGGERHKMKLTDKLIEKERERERKLARETTQDNNSITQTILHFSHPHPLIYVKPDYSYFQCNSCSKDGRGQRYHCGECKFDIHKICAQTPITWLLHHMPPEKTRDFGVRWEVITTFAHEHHELATEYRKRSFRCNHCNHFGDGLRFECHACDIGFHQACARNPTRLTSFLHPEHELELMLRPYFKKCDLCGTNTGPTTNNRVYGCKTCKFFLHSECSQWPLYLAHPMHPPHLLLLKPCGIKLYTCYACRGLAQGHTYNCKLCGIHFHLGCIWKHSKRSMGDEVRQSYAGQVMNILPVTNLTSPEECRSLCRVVVTSSASSRGETMESVSESVESVGQVIAAIVDMASSE